MIELARYCHIIHVYVVIAKLIGLDQLAYVGMQMKGWSWFSGSGPVYMIEARIEGARTTEVAEGPRQGPLDHFQHQISE